MLTAVVSAQHVIQQSVNVLLSGPDAHMFDSEIVHYNIDDVRRSQDSLPEKYIITIGKGAPIKRVVVYNSLTFTRHEVITLLVSTPFVQVSDHIIRWFESPRIYLPNIHILGDRSNW